MDRDKSTGAPTETTRRPQLAVERKLEVVTLTITCETQYAAMELYDQVCASARNGYVELEMETSDVHS